MLAIPEPRKEIVIVAFCAAGTIFAIGVLLYFRLFYVDIAKIDGIPEIPNGNLLAGHLYQLKEDHANTLHLWSLRYGWPVFQGRMGYRRAVFINSFDTAQEWITKNHAATADRPWFHTFHGVVSATSAATIGSSPWNERTKKQRRIFGSYTTTPSIKKMRPLMDLESYDLLSEIYEDSQKGSQEISPHIYMKRMALNSMMMFGYGARFTSTKDPLFHRIVSDAKVISSFRSSNSNYVDFIPHLRYKARNDRVDAAFEVRARRDRWLKAMFDNVQQTIGFQELPVKPIAELMLTDSENGLTEFDFKTMLGGLMSGGFDTLYTSGIMGVGVLASSIGQDIQEKAYKDLLSHYDSPEQAFQCVVEEEKSTYISAFAKEVLRLYPPLKLLPPRQTLKEFVYHGARIPKGVLIYLNSQAINRDADIFRVERWLEKEANPLPPTLYTFGAGARVCTGVNFAHRILYTIYARYILAFKIHESKAMPVNLDLLDYNSEPTAASTCPKDFKVTLTPRNKADLQRFFQKSREMCADVKPGPVPT